MSNEKVKKEENIIKARVPKEMKEQFDALVEKSDGLYETTAHLLRRMIDLATPIIEREIENIQKSRYRLSSQDYYYFYKDEFPEIEYLSKEGYDLLKELHEKEKRLLSVDDIEEKYDFYKEHKEDDLVSYYFYKRLVGAVEEAKSKASRGNAEE